MDDRQCVCEEPKKEWMVSTRVDLVDPKERAIFPARDSNVDSREQ
jgi:hypothetical protein